MAIEPLGSVMSVQAQGAVTQKPVTTDKVEIPTNTVQPVEKVDATTNVVENAQGKGQNNGAAEQQTEQQATNEQIKKAVEQLNKKLTANSEAVFGIHEATNRVTIKIVDKETKEVIKEVPPEKTLDMIAKVWEIAGILVDEKR